MRVNVMRVQRSVLVVGYGQQLVEPPPPHHRLKGLLTALLVAVSSLNVRSSESSTEFSVIFM